MALQRIFGTRDFTFKVVAVLCAVFVLAMGIAQATHSHSDDPAGLDRHSCTICSAPSLGPVTAAVTVAPLIGVVAQAPVAEQATIVFLPAASFFIRPPPAA